MKTFLASLAAVALGSYIDMAGAEEAFVEHIYKHGLEFSSAHEYLFRLDIFQQNYAKVLHHNLSHASEDKFTMTLNKFATMTTDEFNLMKGYNAKDNVASNIRYLLPANSDDSINWVEAGAVTDVKNQATCGSCWSFSTTGSLEGAHQIATGELISLSEQQFVDCSKSYGNLGCMGGLMDSAFDYAKDTAIVLESDYPYQGWSFGGCKLSSEGVVKAASYSDVPVNDPAQLEAYLAKGPVSIAIDASGAQFQLYKTGIITQASCGTNLDHGVLLVGMGEENGTKYWLVKNSWDSTWGENGYFKLERTDAKDAGTCGLQTSASQVYV